MGRVDKIASYADVAYPTRGVESGLRGYRCLISIPLIYSMKAHLCCRETLFSLCLLMLAGCSRSGPEPFHERGNFSGRVRIEHQNAVSSGVIVCDVAFQREGRDRDQNLQVTFRQKGSAVTLSEDPQGKVQAFAGEQWREPDVTELAKFKVVRHLFMVPLGQGEIIKLMPDGYEREEPDRKFKAVVEESFAFHGH